jgi:uncharacterized protein YlzI (FlbEa/FlbD family)
MWYHIGMKMVKIKLLNGAEIWINPDTVCDVRKDPMTENCTLIQLNQGFHKVKLPMEEVLDIFGVKHYETH